MHPIAPNNAKKLSSFSSIVIADTTVITTIINLHTFSAQYLYLRSKLRLANKKFSMTSLAGEIIKG